MIALRYFASLREQLGLEQEQLDTQAQTVAALRAELRARGGAWADALAADRPLLSAVNQTVVQLDAPIQDGDEVAFFPPVTGG